MWGASGIALSIAPRAGSGRCISRDRHQGILAHAIGRLLDRRCNRLGALLHDWDDDRSIDILRACRRAMSTTATLFVIERVIGPPNEIPEGKFSGLNMMVQYAALERTRNEFSALLQSGGFQMTEVVPTRSPLSIVVGRPKPIE
jgi:hypothetical protein